MFLFKEFTSLEGGASVKDEHGTIDSDETSDGRYYKVINEDGQKTRHRTREYSHY